MIKRLIQCFCLLTLCACSSTSKNSTPSALTQYEQSIQRMTEYNQTKVPTGDYLKTFSEIAKGYNSKIETYDTANGRIHVFRVNGANIYTNEPGFNYNSDFESFKASATLPFDKSCQGQIDKSDFLEEADLINDAFNPLHYIDQELLETIKKSASTEKSRGSNLEEEKTFKRYLRPITSKYRGQDRLQDINRLYFYDEEITGTENSFENRYYSPYGIFSSCFIEGKLVGVMTYVISESRAKGPTQLVGIYIPAEASEQTVKGMFTRRLKSQKLDKQSQLEKQEKIKRVNEKFRIQQAEDQKLRQQYDLAMAEQKGMWDVKHILGLEVGQQVCSYKGNKLGYVEEIVKDRIKVLWKGAVNMHPDGFFFGNKSFGYYKKHKGRFEFQKQDDVVWVESKEIALCGFTN